MITTDIFKMKVFLIIIAVLLLVRISCCISLNRHGQYAQTQCLGTVPPAGSSPECKTNERLFKPECYPPCPAGYTKKEFHCHQNCPAVAGWEDQGLFCRLVEYGRGVGYAWHVTDGLSNSGMFSRCEKDNGQGNCELIGAIVYPKCRPGYVPVGCCICRPNIPNCETLGYKKGIDISCQKKILCWD